jgi:hypothetical protein
MQKYNIAADLGNCCLNVGVRANNLYGALLATVAQLAKFGISEDRVLTMRITVIV